MLLPHSTPLLPTRPDYATKSMKPFIIDRRHVFWLTVTETRGCRGWMGAQTKFGRRGTTASGHHNLSGSSKYVKVPPYVGTLQGRMARRIGSRIDRSTTSLRYRWAHPFISITRTAPHRACVRAIGAVCSHDSADSWRRIRTLNVLQSGGDVLIVDSPQRELRMPRRCDDDIMTTSRRQIASCRRRPTLMRLHPVPQNVRPHVTSACRDAVQCTAVLEIHYRVLSAHLALRICGCSILGRDPQLERTQCQTEHVKAWDCNRSMAHTKK